MTDDGAARDFDLRGLIENSLLEWEGKLAAVAIAGGCNLRCPFCHSWRYVTGLADLEPIDHERLFGLLERQAEWLDGVVFTGGEPTLQPGLERIVRRAREYGAAIKLHSNGTRPDVVERLLGEGLLDCLALDYKAPEDGRYFAAAGIPANADLADRVRRSFAMAKSAGIDVEYHTTLWPGVVDGRTFAAMAEELDAKGLWILQQFESGDCLDPKAAGARRFSGAELEALEVEAKKNHARVLLKQGK